MFANFIPLGGKPRLRNDRVESAETIEVQVDDYPGEDDIIRIGDRRGREGD